MRNSFLVFALIFGLGASSHAQAVQDGMTLGQSITRVLERYPSLDAAKAEIDAAGGRTTQSISGRLLHVSANAQYSYLSFRPFVAIPAFPSLYETIQNSYTATISAQSVA